jgi:hypothetical protein
VFGVWQWRGKRRCSFLGENRQLEDPDQRLVGVAWLFLCQVSAVFSAAAKTGMTLTGEVVEVLHAAAKGWRLRTSKIGYVSTYRVIT